MNQPHWHYFLLLEDELVGISRFVELSEDNYEVYSIEFAKLFLSICSEVDVVAKLLCKEADSPLFDKTKGSRDPNMSTYRCVINSKFPDFHKAQVKIPLYNLSFEPWNNFKIDKSLPWWNEYNDVKHERNINFKKANLGNVLFSMSGLMVLLVYLYGYQSVVSLTSPNKPKLYEIESAYYRAQGIAWASSELYVPKGFIK
ncbi:hypothetical protein [Desulfospira joergensenii]|uniref:hypothetical protein n=1 Tax=Desulfospira joergensenii TaxID=53329 RepID=UPI0003B52300|nr:hypothetical protein [Desulfospira joergensenii]